MVVRHPRLVLRWPVPEYFPLRKLTRKQAAIVSDLLREHPHGIVHDRDGIPVFVSKTAQELFEVDLISRKTHFSKLDPEPPLG